MSRLFPITMQSIQLREEHWVIADLVGKGGHIRTVPIPVWVKKAVDAWTEEAQISEGACSDRSTRKAESGEMGMTPKVLWEVVKDAAARAGIEKLAAHDLKENMRTFMPSRRRRIGSDSVLARHVSIQTTERHLGCKQKLSVAVNDKLGIEPDETF
jgi:site-specific recombinase XerD